MSQTIRYAVRPDGTKPQVFIGGDVPEWMVEVSTPPPETGATGYDFEMQTWVAYTPTPAFPTLTPRQLRLMLLNIGITEAQVDAEIDAITDPIEQDASRIEWKYASAYERDHPLIDQMATAFSLPPAQVDTLWLAAADL
jgi:hypothetical protein